MRTIFAFILALLFFLLIRLPFGLLEITLKTLGDGGKFIEVLFIHVFNPIGKKIYDFGKGKKK